jgi:hypothetical protein
MATLIKVRQFLTKVEKNPVPFRTMQVASIERETEKAVLVTLKGTAEPSNYCTHCGREIKHPQSLRFGIGSTCLPKHYPHLFQLIGNEITEESINAHYSQLKDELEKITWHGWLPKAHIEMEHDTALPVYIVEFTYNGTVYRTKTMSEDKLNEIKSKAQKWEVKL